MKAFENKQKATHLEHGVGIVQRTRLNGTQGWIDFKGNHAQWFHATDKSIQMGVNVFTPKQETITIELLKEKIAMVKGEYCNGNSSHAEGGRIALEQLEKMITNK